MIHGVEQARVALDQAARNHSYGAGFADARFIVAVDIRAHRELGFFFGRRQQFADVIRVAQRIPRAAGRARDGASLHARLLTLFHAHEHLRRSADQLLVAELEQKLVRAGTGLLNALEQLRGAARVRRAERLAENHFVVIAQAHSFADGFDVGGVLGGRMVADNRARRRLLFRFLDALGGVRKSARGVFAARKIKPVPFDVFLLAIHEVDVIAQEQAQILDAGARMLEANRVEAEQQIVTKCAHQGEAARQTVRGTRRSARAAEKRPRAACCVPLPGTARAAA